MRSLTSSLDTRISNLREPWGSGWGIRTQSKRETDAGLLRPHFGGREGLE